MGENGKLYNIIGSGHDIAGKQSRMLPAVRVTNSLASLPWAQCDMERETIEYWTVPSPTYNGPEFKGVNCVLQWLFISYVLCQRNKRIWGLFKWSTPTVLNLIVERYDTTLKKLDCCIGNLTRGKTWFNTIFMISPIHQKRLYASHRYTRRSVIGLSIVEMS